MRCRPEKCPKVKNTSIFLAKARVPPKIVILSLPLNDISYMRLRHLTNQRKLDESGTIRRIFMLTGSVKKKFKKVSLMTFY